MIKNHYKTLGLESNATEEDIKKAYRNLAKQFHPDISKDPKAEEKFKEISEAYDALKNGDEQEEESYNPFGGGFTNGGFTFFQQSSNNIETDIYLSTELTFLEACLGVEKNIEYKKYIECDKCHEYKTINGKLKFDICKHCNGTGRTIRRTPLMNIAMPCLTCHGTGGKIDCNSCNGKGVKEQDYKLNVKIPAGVNSHNHIRIFKEGNFDYINNLLGNVYISIKVHASRDFTRNKLDIFNKIKVDFMDCLLGNELEVDTIYGKEKIRINECTKNGEVIKINGKGIITNNLSGSHYTTIEVEIPNKLDKLTKRVLTSLRKKKEKLKNMI